MIKPVSLKFKWLTGLILVTIVTLLASGGCAVNQLPIISGLILATAGDIYPGATAQIECDASDPDEDELSYIWSADGGTISGSGANVSWQAPDELGTYTINVEVSDGDDIATSQLSIPVVEANNPPFIESLTAEWVSLKKASNTPITCVASDPNGDTLTYEWSAVDEDERLAGSFVGEGDTVTWYAPNDYGFYFISVIVSDGRGGEYSATIRITVCACGGAH